jgi:hypothetical protein
MHAFSDFPYETYALAQKASKAEIHKNVITLFICGVVNAAWDNEGDSWRALRFRQIIFSQNFVSID